MVLVKKVGLICNARDYGGLLYVHGMETPAYADSDIGITIDGNSVAFQSGYGEPFIDVNSRTLVPLRGVMEAFWC